MGGRVNRSFEKNPTNTNKELTHFLILLASFEWGLNIGDGRRFDP